MPAYDYSAIADVYDDFCVFDGDIDIFRDVTAQIGGPVLELMAGTGRVSLPLLRNGTQLTCVDRCASMLAVLAAKLRPVAQPARLVCADVCDMPFGHHFEMAILPFQGFTELVGGENQKRVFEEVARILAVGGRFVCTSHNPAVRSETIDGEWHEIGRFPLSSGHELVVRLCTSFGDRPGEVEGTQMVEIFDQNGAEVDRRELDLTFSLRSPREIARLAAGAGPRPRRWYGDYQRSEFDEGSSPIIIAEFEKDP